MRDAGHSAKNDLNNPFGASVTPIGPHLPAVDGTDTKEETPRIPSKQANRWRAGEIAFVGEPRVS